jgi:hypothetical protein
MATLRALAVSSFVVRPRPALTSQELRRQVDLIEDRPEEALTWSDAMAFLRSTARSIGAVLRPSRR